MTFNGDELGAPNATTNSSKKLNFLKFHTGSSFYQASIMPQNEMNRYDLTPWGALEKSRISDNGEVNVDKFTTNQDIYLLNLSDPNNFKTLVESNFNPQLGDWLRQTFKRFEYSKDGKEITTYVASGYEAYRTLIRDALQAQFVNKKPFSIHGIIYNFPSIEVAQYISKGKR